MEHRHSLQLKESLSNIETWRKYLLPGVLFCSPSFRLWTCEGAQLLNLQGGLHTHTKHLHQASLFIHILGKRWIYLHSCIPIRGSKSVDSVNCLLNTALAGVELN